jgi:hypothetical protein
VYSLGQALRANPQLMAKFGVDSTGRFTQTFPISAIDMDEIPVMPGQEHDGFYRCSTQRILTISDNYSKGFQAPVAIENQISPKKSTSAKRSPSRFDDVKIPLTCDMNPAQQGRARRILSVFDPAHSNNI